MSTAKTQAIIRNKVSDYCYRNGLDKNDFIGRCLSSKRRIDNKGLTYDTASRVFDGDTGLSLTTAGLVAAALGVQIGDLFDIE
jgi:hypothetical protein